MADRLLFPPTTVADMRQRGWDAPDFVYVSGDAYVDHPSFGAAVIVRTLEAAGYHVAVLAQPNWKNANDFKRFGRPNYGFLVSSGVIDSMVNHYTAAKRRRSSDVYTPGGKAAKRPDRAVNVYCRLIREAYGDIPIAIGGVAEAPASYERYASAYFESFEQLDAFKLLLVHYPEYFLEDGFFSDVPVDLALCGHTHGGMIRIPGIGGLYTPDQGVLPTLTEGLHQIGDTSLIISRGLGDGKGTPVPRINNPPELVIVDINWF